MKKLFSIVFLTLLFASCRSGNSYNINGEIEGATWNGKLVSLHNITSGAEMAPIDSVIIKNGSFKFKGRVDTLGWYLLVFTGDKGQPTYKDFYMEGDLNVKFANNQFRITGGPINEKYQAFQDKYFKLTANIIKLDAAYKAEPDNKEIEQAFNDEYKRFEASFSALAVQAIKDNMDNPVALHVFQAALSTFENSDLEKVLSFASPAFLADPSVKMVVEQMALSKNVSIGSPYVDLAMFTPDGAPISLSQYVGKGSYVLIDFWASWCAPCIRELPNVLECYSAFHDKGFEIVGVSLDGDTKAWKAAIDKYNLKWPQMSDLAGWQSKAVSLYSFSGIPHTVLLDPKGIIIANDLRGSALKEKLSELLGK
jgi:peroxiredoxin